MKSNFYLLCIVIIFALGVFLRFDRYSDRWGLADDQAHDAVVARYAVDQHKIPLMGPFSSAGPFQTSGVWYWFIMLGTVIYPSSVLSPWILLTTMYVLFVLGMIFLGTMMIDRKFGLLVGLLSAISTAQIAQSVSLTNQSPLSLTAFFCLVCFMYYSKNKKNIYLFFLGFFVSLSASIHLQGVSLIVLPVTLFLFYGLPSGKGFLAFVFGLFLPGIPILLFDSFHNFVTLKNMLYYLRVDQYRIPLDVLGRRWTTFLTVFLPAEWSHVIGGIPIVGKIILIATTIAMAMAIPFYKKYKLFFAISVSVALSSIILRYTHAPLFSSYIVFLHPSILILTAFGIYILTQRNMIIGVLFCSLVIISTMSETWKEINYGVNLSDQQARYWVSIITQVYPTQKFAIYDYKLDTKAQSAILGLYLESRKQISDTGIKLAVLRSPSEVTPSGSLLIIDGDKRVYDVSSSTSARLSELGWYPMNPSYIYASTENWIK